MLNSFKKGFNLLNQLTTRNLLEALEAPRFPHMFFLDF
ncbi:hypothetical protein NSPZN2_10023 [Nitrospira defluvii]|uniref:Transposase n=1 Tax=Nitrospira defluvii TaxID=330214 RepID=A0ABM8QBE3_9BACT|nr:hypothetical protein NSPZN2_10023 [Nitrospira defluvii]